MVTTTIVARATTPTSQRRRRRRDGSPDPSLVMPLEGVTSMMCSIPCCVGHLTDTLGPSSIAVWSTSTVTGIPGPLGGDLLGASSRGWSSGWGGLLGALFYL
jgi:hypothetical protein